METPHNTQPETPVVQLRTPLDDNATREAIAYIKKIAALGAYNIEGWDLLSVFASHNDASRIMTDKRAINKRLHEHSVFTEAQSRDLSAIEKELLTSFEDTLAARHREEAARLRRTRDSQAQRATEALRTADSYLHAARKSDEEANILLNRPPTLTKEIEKIVAGGFFSFEGTANGNISPQQLKFQTRIPIRMTEVNLSAGINHNVLMGPYKVVFYPIDGRLRVFPVDLASCCMVDYYFHPYINREGAICWGDATDTVTKSLARGKFAETFELLQALLTTYTPSATPYMALHRFAKVQERPKVEPTPIPIVVCRICERDTSNCTCQECGACGELFTEDYLNEDGFCDSCNESRREDEAF